MAATSQAAALDQYTGGRLPASDQVSLQRLEIAQCPLSGTVAAAAVIELTLHPVWNLKIDH